MYRKLTFESDADKLKLAADLLGLDANTPELEKYLISYVLDHYDRHFKNTRETYDGCEIPVSEDYYKYAGEYAVVVESLWHVHTDKLVILKDDENKE